jgi:hypothetical protein
MNHGSDNPHIFFNCELLIKTMICTAEICISENQKPYLC